MAVLNIVGFETGDTDESNNTFGELSVQNIIKRSGNFALKVNPVGTNTGSYTIGTTDNKGRPNGTVDKSTVWIRFYFRWEIKPATASNFESVFTVQDSTGVSKFVLVLYENATLEIRNADFTALTSTPALTQSVWYRIEMKVPTSPLGTTDPMPYEVRLDGSVVASGSSYFGDKVTRRVVLGKGVDQSGESIEVYYDDYAISDSDWLGPGAIVNLKAASQGFYTSWTGTYIDVDEVPPHDGLTTVIYNQDGSTSPAETVKLENAASAGVVTPINAVKGYVYAAHWFHPTQFKTAHRTRLRISSTDYDSSADNEATPVNNFMMFSNFREKNPKTFLPWTLGDLGNLEVGIVNKLVNGWIRCTMIGAMVDYVPGGGNASNAIKLRWNVESYPDVNRSVNLKWDITQCSNCVSNVIGILWNVGDVETSGGISLKSPPYEDIIIKSKPVGYWNLGESSGTTADNLGTTGAAIDGTYNGGFTLTTTALASASPSTAITIDGIDGYVSVPNHITLNLGVFENKSVQLWFRANGVTAKQVLYEQGGTQRGFNIYIRSGKLFMGGWNLFGVWRWGPSWISTTIKPTVRYHVVMSFDGVAETLKGYINGSIFGTITGALQLRDHAGGIGIGAMKGDAYFQDGPSTGATGFFLNGVLDEVATYNKSLTATDASLFHTLGLLPYTVGFVYPTTGNISLNGSAATTYRAVYTSSGGITLSGTVVGEPDYEYIPTGGISTVPLTYQQTILADSPIAYWRLNETVGTTAVNLGSATSANGTYNNVTLGTRTLPTIDGFSASFNGTNSHLAVADNTAINIGSSYTKRTIELWFSARDITKRQVVYEEGGSQRGFNIYIDQGQVYVNAWNVVNDGPCTPWGPKFLNTAISLNERYYVAITFDGVSGDVEGFLNCQSIGVATGACTMFSHPGNIGIGARAIDTYFHDGGVFQAGIHNHFNGLIDEVALYNAVLSDNDICEHCNAGIACCIPHYPYSVSGGLVLGGTDTGSFEWKYTGSGYLTLGCS